MNSKEKEINNLKYIIKDLLYGDEKVSKRDDYDKAKFEDIKKGLNLLINNPNLNNQEKLYLLQNNWKLIYEQKPPTPNEFLSKHWLGETAEHLFPYLKTHFIEFWKEDSLNNNYRHFILSSHIGWGKSYITMLSNLYIQAHMCCLRDYKKYLNKSPASTIFLVLISFTEETAKELYLDPLMELVETSPKFQRKKTIESMKKSQKDNPNIFYFTTAGTSAIQFEKGLHIKIASDPGKIIGRNVLSGSLSELSFWREYGFSDEKIWRMFADLKGRIKNRFQSNFFARSIVDSSPNSLETKVDKYIWNEALKDKQNYLVTGPMWKYQTWNFKDLDSTFPVYKGSGSKQPKILKDTEIDNFTLDDVINVPKFMSDGTDLYEMFSKDLNKSLKDFAGVPAGLADKLISNLEYIENIFDDSLQNLYTHIFAPADKMPEKLIWNQIVDDFFIKIGNNKYEFYRSPHEIRYLAVDQSETKDLTGISMVHLETNIKGETICIVDFTITIVPTKTKINLNAIEQFIIDLYMIGKIKFGGIYFDRHQSSPAIQSLDRLGLPVKWSSVDIKKEPYYALISWIQNGRIKCGRNLYFKNNLKSLKEIKTKNNKTKIDHTIGNVETEGDTRWKTSIIGYNAKDTSDSVCNAFYNCIQEYKGIPKYQYLKNKNIVSDKESALKLLDDKYSFKLK